MNKSVDQRFAKAQDNALKCLALSRTQRFTVYVHRGGKKSESHNSKKLETLNFFFKILLKSVDRFIKIVGD